jgi:nucleoside-diphosphate-sugar epimerase
MLNHGLRKDYEMKSALVVGGSGFLGLHTVRRLASHGYRVFATYHSSQGLPALANVTWIPTDLSQTNAAANWPTSCDYLIYLAQSRRYRHFPEAADEVFQVNVHGLMQALSYARHAKVQHAVLASSGSVYASTHAPAKETDVISLQAHRNFYAATKLAAETLAAAYSSVVPITQLRIFFPYGLDQSEDMLFPNLVKRVQQGQAIQLQGPDGFLANPLFAPDAAAAIERCLSLSTSMVLNLAGPESLRLRAMGEHLGKVLGKLPLFEVKSTDSGPIIVGDMQAMQAALGWTPQTRLLDGLHRWLEVKQRNAA